MICAAASGRRSMRSTPALPTWPSSSPPRCARYVPCRAPSRLSCPSAEPNSWISTPLCRTYLTHRCTDNASDPLTLTLCQIVLAFRGIEKTAADWAANFQPNLENLTAAYDTATGSVHGAFLEEYKVSRDQLFLTLVRLLGNADSQVRHCLYYICLLKKKANPNWRRNRLTLTPCSFCIPNSDSLILITLTPTNPIPKPKSNPNLNHRLRCLK